MGRKAARPDQGVEPDNPFDQVVGKLLESGVDLYTMQALLRRSALKHAIELCGNRVDAAKMLGFDRSTLSRIATHTGKMNMRELGH